MRVRPFAARDCFGAPWGTQLKLISLLGTAVLLIAGVLVWVCPAPGEVGWCRGASLCCAGLLGGCALFAVRGYRLETGALFVRRLFWETRVPLQGLRSVSRDPEAMKRSLRLFGNGGLFAFTGWFRNRRLGRYRAYATDPARAVVLVLPRSTIVVTPHDPAAFTRALEAEHG